MPVLRPERLLQKGLIFMIAYYVMASAANIIFLIAFSRFLNITVCSIVPMIVLLLLTVWSFYYKEQGRQMPLGDTSYTALGERFSKEERSALYICLSNSFRVIIPFCLPFVLFFPNYIKAFSVLLYFAAIILGRWTFNCKHKEEINARLSRESCELEEQIKKEENGNL